MSNGECRVVKVDGENMPADFLTKWTPADEFKKSIAYATNARSRARAEGMA